MHATPLSQNRQLGEYLREFRLHNGLTVSELAKKTRISRLTIAAAEGHSDPKLSTILALLDEMGYRLLPVPKAIESEVVNFINNGGQVVMLPAGTTAPLGGAQSAFAKAKESQEPGSGS